MSNQFGATSGSYPDLDRFNRPGYSRWTIDAAIDRDFYRMAVAWGRGSNVTSQTDEIWSTSGGTYTINGLVPGMRQAFARRKAVRALVR
jgi:hypothetical protein